MHADALRALPDDVRAHILDLYRDGLRRRLVLWTLRRVLRHHRAGLDSAHPFYTAERRAAVLRYALASGFRVGALRHLGASLRATAARAEGG